jgi:excisionase family DNA binding protein
VLVELLTPGQAARLLGCTPRHARRLLDPVAIRTAGGHRRFRADHVAELVQYRSRAARDGRGVLR